MNKPFTLPVQYEHDVYGWALRQSELLRAGRIAEIDTDNIAEEIEALGSAEYHRLVSALRILFIHMLKWDYQQERQSRSWTLTIDEHRDQLERYLRRSPSLKSALDEAIPDAYREARRAAARETDLPLATFPATNPYTWQDVTDRPYPWDE